MISESDEKTGFLEQLRLLRAEMEAQIAAIATEISELRASHGTRIEGLEQSAALFEEHRQSWINLNEKLRGLKDDMDRDDQNRRSQERRLDGYRARIRRIYGEAVTPREERLLLLVFDMVLEHCTDEKGRLNNWGREPYTGALKLLAEAGFVRIDEEIEDHILATSLP
jgi:hypothetical protein